MAIWERGRENEIVVIVNTPGDYEFEAYYRRVGDSGFTKLDKSFVKLDDYTYVLKHSFDFVGKVLLKVVEQNNKIRPMFATIEVVPYLDFLRNNNIKLARIEKKILGY